MKKLRIFSAALISFLLVAQGVMAQETAMSPLIDASALSKINTKKEVVVVSTRKKKDYDLVHITGAVHVDYRQLVNDPAGMGLMRTPEELAAYLGKAGISETSEIVVYDDGSMKAASRVFWVLKYLGAQNVKILDGGIDAWKAARKPVTSTATVVKATTFNVTLNPEIIISKEDFEARHAADAVVDAREPEEYTGEKKSSFQTRGGHIPGAINIPMTSLVADGSFLPKEDITTLVNEAGVNGDKEIIVYCNSGVKAAVVYFALVEVAGFENVKLYEGSFNEWESDPNHEVAQ